MPLRLPLGPADLAPEAWLTLPEELDMDACDAVSERFARALVRGHGRIVMDCGMVRFIDTAGLRFLVAAGRAARRDGIRLVLAEPTPILQRLLRLAGLADYFEFEPQPGVPAAPVGAAHIAPHWFPVADLAGRSA